MRKPRVELTDEQSLKNLGIISLFTHHEVVGALEASLIAFVADRFFGKNPGQFRTNPANTMTYQLLTAIEDRCVVRVAETLKSKYLRTKVAIRGKSALIKHRDAVSHTGTVEWDSPAMQKFADEGRQWDELRSALLWDMDKSVGEALLANGKPLPTQEVTPTPEMARLLHLILDSSRKTDVGVPDVPALGGFLAANTARYVAILEKYPDGQVHKPHPAGAAPPGDP